MTPSKKVTKNGSEGQKVTKYGNRPGLERINPGRRKPKTNNYVEFVANQYTQAREQGISPDHPDWPKQAETRREHPEEVRAAIRASVAARYLQTLVEDETAETAHRVSASKILLDKTIASLSSVDQTISDNRDDESPEQLEAKLRMLIDRVNRSNPSLLSHILGTRARELGTPIQPVEVGEAHDNNEGQTA
jgi:hypothetical protein